MNPLPTIRISRPAPLLLRWFGGVGPRLVRHRLTFALTLTSMVGLVASPAVLRADECTVPSTHATISAALADSGCGAVTLQPGTYVEDLLLDRPLTLSGPSDAEATLRGSIDVSGGVGGMLRDLTVESGCGLEALFVFGTADLTLDNVELRPLAECALIFSSGFETGGLGDWTVNGGTPRESLVRPADRIPADRATAEKPPLSTAEPDGPTGS